MNAQEKWAGSKSLALLRQGPFRETGMIGLSASSAMLRHADDSHLFQETIQKPFDLEYLLEAVRQHVA